MALSKKIELENGIEVNYHRIVSLNKITNISNVIEIASYANRKQREKEEAYQNLQKKNIEDDNSLTEEERDILNQGINVFISTDIISIPYDETMTIESAYEYLKTLDKFKNAEDI